MTPDELRKLYAQLHSGTALAQERREARHALAESVPSLLDELDVEHQMYEHACAQRDKQEESNEVAHCWNQQLDEARRELEELRSAAAALLNDLDANLAQAAHDYFVHASPRLRALVAPSVPETQETTDG